MITVPEIDGVTQARNLKELKKMAQELIAVTLDVPLCEVDVDVRFGRVGDVECVSQRADAIQSEREQARQLERQVAEEQTQLAHELAKANVTVRDIGSILGVSHQRAQQLVSH